MRLRKVLIIGIAILIGGCSTVSNSETVVWYFQVAAPQRYEVWVEHLELEASGVRHWRQAPGIVSCCWQGEGGPRGKGGRMEPFPDYIGIEWFSYAEQVFYQRLVSLPEEWKEHMLELAPQKNAHGEVYKPRNTLVLGLAPGGEIVIWIKNQLGNEIEIARLQANKIDGDASNYQSRSRDYLERHGEYLKKHGIPLEGW
ncbi:DUF2931 family protein [Marinobacter arenosus]|uniref:DUF2931 family protein n=1 Tax=Marinobacter arenosus TaxID=2856822 RepID=UPI001E64D167|nr:DUF2931 family protein [Marinobacter arenosus]